MQVRSRVAVVAVAVLAMLALPAIASARLVRIGSIPFLPSGTTPLAGVASSQRIRITVVLVPRDPAALSRYAQAVSDPSSADYRHYLTPAQFRARFAPRAATVAAVRSALRERGLRTGVLTPNGLSLHVNADIGTVEHALAVGFERVALRGGRVAELATQAPAVASTIAPAVQAIVGLSGLQHLTTSIARGSGRRSAQRRTTGEESAYAATGGPTACSAATAAGTRDTSYTVPQVAAAYQFSGLYAAGDYGSGVTVAAYELEPYDASDIAAYQQCYGTDAVISNLPVDGGSGTGAGSGEAALDIEQVIGLAPKIHLLVYEGPNSDSNGPGSGPYDTFADIVSDDKAEVITNSWGQCEELEGKTDAEAEDTLFEEAAAQGQTMISVSGDDGSEDCDGESALGAAELAVDDPGSQPFVTSVGGTSMTAVGPPPTETTWNSGGGLTETLGLAGGFGAGGGGISTFWTIPSYQSGAPTSDHVISSYSSGTPCGDGSGDCREVPDVSADADPEHGYEIYYNGAGTQSGAQGWQAFGGTSTSAPLWAAVLALADADKTCDGSSVGFANPALYRLGAAPGYFNDITSGNNDFTGLEGQHFPAGVGYDMATGLGTPDATALAAGLCAEVLRLSTPHAQRSYVGSTTKLKLAGADGPGLTVKLTASGLPKGLKVDSTAKEITGKPTKAGRYTVTLQAADTGSGHRLAAFSWTVGALPSVSALAVSRALSSHPTVALTLKAGRDAPALSSATVTLGGGLILTGRVRKASARLKLSGRAGSPAAAAAVRTAAEAGHLTATVTTVDADGGRARQRLKLRVSS